MLTMKPQDPPVSDRLEQSTDPACHRESKLTVAWIIGVSVAVVSLLDLVRRHLLPGSDIWFLALLLPTWLVICLFSQYRRG